MATSRAIWRSHNDWACAVRRVTARAARGARRVATGADPPRWTLRLAVCVTLTCAGLTTALATSAGAAFPGRNGVIAYFWSDPEADLAYLAFVAPDGAAASPWLAQWNESDVGDLAFSPDGLRVAGAFEGRNRNAIGVATAPSMRVDVITHPPLDDIDRYPSWSPDGTVIVFEREDSHQNPLLYSIHPDGSHLRRLGHAGESPVWSTLGRIAVQRNRHNDDRWSIYTINTAGRQLHRLTYGRHDESPDWSPDGQRLAFERNGDIYTIAGDGSGLRRLTSGRRWDSEPQFSPDGTQIVFITGRKLAIIPVAGGPLRTFRCEQPGCFDPDWLPAPAGGAALPRPGASTSTAGFAGIALPVIGPGARASTPGVRADSSASSPTISWMKRSV